MKARLILVLAVVTAAFGFCVSELKAVDIIFTSDGVIDEPNIYGRVEVVNDATVDMIGGAVGGLYIWDQSTFNLSGGSVQSIYALDSSTVNITGGSVARYIDAHDSSIINVDGGVIRAEHGISMVVGSTLNMYNGDVYIDYVKLGGTINVYGGNVEVNYCYGDGMINIYCGFFTFPGDDMSFSEINIYSGVLTFPDEMYISGSPDGAVNIYGGILTFPGDVEIWVSPRSAINIYGYDFHYDPAAGVNGGGLLTGYLADGNAFSINGIDEQEYLFFNLITDWTIIASVQIQAAIAEKLEAIEKINAAQEKEQTAMEAIDELLAGGELGDLSRRDVIWAKNRARSAIIQERIAKFGLKKTIRRLEDALDVLGWEQEPQICPKGPLPEPLPGADINKDGVVDFQDFSVLAETWLKSSQTK
ncbi:MAG: hypothetical protein ACYS0I_05070 [Planctomycetota bacterium]|jgi:hypothetical protein